jgi:hypothetical protein
VIPQRYGPDLAKIRDALAAAERHHVARDESNAALHLGEVRYSPLTSTLVAERERVDRLFAEVQGGEA